MAVSPAKRVSKLQRAQQANTSCDGLGASTILPSLYNSVSRTGNTTGYYCCCASQRVGPLGPRYWRMPFMRWRSKHGRTRGALAVDVVHYVSTQGFLARGRPAIVIELASLVQEVPLDRCSMPKPDDTRMSCSLPSNNGPTCPLGKQMCCRCRCMFGYLMSKLYHYFSNPFTRPLTQAVKRTSLSPSTAARTCNTATSSRVNSCSTTTFVST